MDLWCVIFWLNVINSRLVKGFYWHFLNLHVRRCLYARAILSRKESKDPWCSHVFFCYASAPTKCKIQPRNRFCLVKRHTAHAGLSAVSLQRGNDSQNSGTSIQIHEQWEFICHHKWCWTAQRHILLSAPYLSMRISSRRENVCTCLQKKNMQSNGNDTEALPVSDTDELPGSAHQCHFFSCHSNREEGWFIPLSSLLTREPYYQPFKNWKMMSHRDTGRSQMECTPKQKYVCEWERGESGSGFKLEGSYLSLMWLLLSKSVTLALLQWLTLTLLSVLYL